MANTKGGKPKVDKSKLEWGDLCPRWILPLSDLVADEVLGKIVDFFVVRNPCKGVSTRGKALSEYGWREDNPPKGGYLERRLFESAGFVKNATFFTGSKREDMKELFLRSGMSASYAYEIEGNRAAMLASGNTVLCLLRTIRNALAHCRFQTMQKNGTRFLVLENGLASGGYFEVKARIVVETDTLLDWIRIIETEASKEIEEEQAKLKKEEELQSARVCEALARMREGSVHKVGDLIGVLGMKKPDVNKVFSQLKEQKLAEYSRTEKKWRAI